MAERRNPYVGPRTFEREERDWFFGREAEARDLVSLVIAERLVLFYAQSGAGKSSLINTRLIPALLEEGFLVLPIARVGGELPEEVEQVDNVFVYNLLLSLDPNQKDITRFAQMDLTGFLAHLTTTDGEHFYYDDTAVPAEEEKVHVYQEPAHILIVDQFEEIVTQHPDRWQDREDFFRQLDRAMADDPLLWVVLTLREKYVATLDPYILLLPGGMRVRFHLQRLGYEAALEAIQRPAERRGRPFAPGVAEELAENLRQIRLPGRAEARAGQFIEAVQLQVVCYRLWENLSLFST